MVTHNGATSSVRQCLPSFETARICQPLLGESAFISSLTTQVGAARTLRTVRFANSIPPRVEYSILILAEYLKTWFEASVLKANDRDIKSYHHDLHPNEWFKGLSGDQPKLLNPIPNLDPVGPNVPEPQPNPFDERKRWTVMGDVRPDSEWHEVSWNQDTDFVNELTVGDRVVLMVRALVSLLPRVLTSHGNLILVTQTPGWLQTVFNAKIEIYYSLPYSDDA